MGKKKAPGSPARFPVGSRVRVRAGATDPDFPGLPLGGWTGTVREIDRNSRPASYLVEWDWHTLRHIDPAYRTRCEGEGLDPGRMWLSEDGLEPDTGGPARVERPTPRGGPDPCVEGGRNRPATGEKGRPLGESGLE